jgi:hypothetical protein
MNNRYFLQICLIASIVVSQSSVLVLGGTDTKNGYTLTVSKGNPEYSPNPALVCDVTTKNAVTTNFKLSIEKNNGYWKRGCI